MYSNAAWTLRATKLREDARPVVWRLTSASALSSCKRASGYTAADQQMAAPGGRRAAAAEATARRRSASRDRARTRRRRASVCRSSISARPTAREAGAQAEEASPRRAVVEDHRARRTRSSVGEERAVYSQGGHRDQRGPRRPRRRASRTVIPSLLPCFHVSEPGTQESRTRSRWQRARPSHSRSGSYRNDAIWFFNGSLVRTDERPSARATVGGGG